MPFGVARKKPEAIDESETFASLQAARIRAETELGELKAELRSIVQKLNAIPSSDAEERSLRMRRRRLEEDLVPELERRNAELLEREKPAEERERLIADRAERDRLVDLERSLAQEYNDARKLLDAKRQAAWSAHLAVKAFDQRTRDEAASKNSNSCILQAIPQWDMTG